MHIYFVCMYIVSILLFNLVCFLLQGEDGMTCLHMAAKGGYIDLMEFLLCTRKADVNVQVSRLIFEVTGFSPEIRERLEAKKEEQEGK